MPPPPPPILNERVFFIDDETSNRVAGDESASGNEEGQGVGGMLRVRERVNRMVINNSAAAETNNDARQGNNVRKINYSADTTAETPPAKTS